MVGWRILLWAVLVLASVLFLYLVRGILLPFVISFMVASLLEPTVRKLRLRGVSRAIAVSTVLVTFYAAITLFAVLVTPSVTRQVTNLTNRAEDFTRELAQADENDSFFLRWNPVVQVQQRPTTNAVDRLFAQYGDYLDRVGLPSTRRAFMDQYVVQQRPKIAKAVQSVVNSFFGILTNVFSQILNLVMIFILVPLILFDFENIRRKSPRWIPPSIRTNTVSMFHDIGDVFAKYLRGMTTVLLLFTTVITIAMVILNVPYALLLGPLFGALYLIPYIGNIVAAITIGGIVGFGGVTHNMIFGLNSPWAYALLCLGVYVGIAFAFDHLIYPQMVGNSVGLSPVVSMFVIFCGGALFGLPGMLVAFPLAGSVKVVLDRLLRVTTTSAEGLALPAVPLRHRSIT